MCTNYCPTSREPIEEYSGAPTPKFECRDEVYPGHQAPIIRLAHEEGPLTHRKECVPAVFGLIPIWSKDGKNYRHTYNARIDSVFQKVSYRNAWKKRQFCIVPQLEDHRSPFDRLRTGIEEPPVIVRILVHLGLPIASIQRLLPARAPPRSPARRVEWLASGHFFQAA